MTMRLVFVNHCHPDTPHVCATRVVRMAEACARGGHQVVLLTQTLESRPPSRPASELEKSLEQHDWSRPFLVDCPPQGGTLVSRLRLGQIPRPVRLPLLAGQYILKSGVFSDWRQGAVAYVKQLARHFRPQACWATFGNTDSWLIARYLARLSNGKWVADLKDPWDVFIPWPLRKLMAQRFHPSAFTALSDQHVEQIHRWFGRNAVTIYSGIDNSFLAAPPPPPPIEPTRLLLVGALYDSNHLSQLCEGLRRWGGATTLVYAGSEAKRLRETLPDWPIEAPGYVDLSQLRHLAAGCHACLYIRNPRALYQHKLVEMLALDRPVLCLPEEASESLVIAAHLGADFRSCPDASSLAQGLTDMLGRHHPVDRGRLSHFTWDNQAQRLLEVLA